jgi:hypothetical protein
MVVDMVCFPSFVAGEVGLPTEFALCGDALVP